MTTQHQLEHPELIAGYSYGQASRSPLSVEDLRALEAAAGLTADDEPYLRLAGEVLAPQAAEMVDAWRSMLGQHAHLACYSAHPDGTPNPEYAAASHPRFSRWIIDACTRPRDQAWLDQQQEIGLRHTSARKNRTDEADSLPEIPLRYFMAFCGPVITSTREFLRRGDHSLDVVDQMHAAWTKVVLLHMTVWTRPYTIDDQW